MKTADDRLRAAARDAMRIFPPGSDLPPLRLPDLTNGDGRMDTAAGRRAAVGGTGPARAWLAPAGSGCRGRGRDRRSRSAAPAYERSGPG